jgi:hypothetical protein
MAAPVTACSSAVYQAPTAAPGQTLSFCIVDTFGNHTTVLKSCCSANHGTISTAANGCNVYCDLDGAQLDSTQSCMETNKAPTFCGQTNITGPGFPSTSSSTGTMTNSAPLPTKSSSTRRFAPKNFLLGMVVLLAVCII